MPIILVITGQATVRVALRLAIMTGRVEVPGFTRVVTRPGIRRILPQAAARRALNPTVAPVISTVSRSTKSRDVIKCDGDLSSALYGVSLNLFFADEHELLNSLAGFYFALVEISVRICYELVNCVELSRVAPIVTEHAHDGTVASAQSPDHIVGVVSH